MGVRSEYQKHFKVSALRKNLPLYYENVAFRTARRDREYAHTPLCWNDDEEDTDSVDTDSVEDTQTKDDKTVGNNVKAEVKDDKDVLKTSSLKDTVILQKRDDERVSNELSTADFSKPVPEKTEEIEEICQGKQKEKSAKKTTGANSKTFIVRPGKQRRPDRKQKIPTRPTSKQSPSRPGSRARTATPHTVEHPAPFMSYGWGDVERDLCEHKTFNVRASTGVHPAALRALSQRKTTAERRSASVKKSAEDKLKALMEAAAREKVDQGSEWKSEYQQRYPAYDQSEYIRSISARSNERKLCRVVYVS